MSNKRGAFHTAKRGYQGCIYLTEYKSKKKDAVTTAALNYRKTPGGERVGTLPCGSAIVFADNSKVTAGGHVWRKIVIDGKTYYAADKYIKS